MRYKIFGILIVFCIFFCCASPGTKQAKIYQGQLETMVGEKTEDLEASFRKWGFNLMHTWEEENPSVEVIKKHNRPVVKFSEVEMQQIFSEEGKYLVLYFQKKEATTDASMGTITEGGMGYMADTVIASDRFTLVRAVFKDGVFSHFKVWGNVHQSHISGQKTIRR
jgi:hypothetical protein